MSGRSAGLHLGLDVGTQGTKGLLLDDASGRIVARAAASYDLIAGLPPGAAEQHPETWLAAVERVVGALLGSPGVERGRLQSVGVSGQQHGLVVLDAGDRVVRPAKLWCDTSTAAEARELEQRLGRAVPTGFTASKVLWLARQEPRHWEAVARVLLPHDYVNFVLTGEAAMEAGDASGTGFFDVVKRRFDEQVVEAVQPGLMQRLPRRLLGAGEVLGRVHAAASRRFGLPQGLLVASGSGDNMMSALGSGASAPGVVVLSLGTSGTAFACSAVPVLDPAGLIAPFCDATGAWLPLLCVMNVTGVTEEVRAAFPGHDLQRLTAEAAAVPAGCDGLLLLPYLQGERVPDLPLASATLTGWRPGHLRAGPLFRAALEGTSLNLALGVRRLAALGVGVSSVRLVGGGAQNPLWRRILADALGVPVQRLLESESAALGAALCGLWTARRAAGEDVDAHSACAPYVALDPEVLEPDRARHALYSEAAGRLEQLTRQVYG